MASKGIYESILDANKTKPSDSGGTKSKDKVVEREKGKDKMKNVVPANVSSAPSTSKESKNDSFAQLCNIMKEGFSTLQNSFANLGQEIAEQVTAGLCEDQEQGMEDVDVIECANESNDVNLFDSISNEFSAEENLGTAVSPEIAKLVNSTLSTKNDGTLKLRDEKYPRPANLEFVQSPKINKPVWNGMKAKDRGVDAQLQEVQKDFLKSTLPIVKVMEELNEARENKNISLNLEEVIKTLSDSLVFLGSANVKMVKTRKEIIKEDISAKFRGICNSEIPFTGPLLFGDNFLQQLKEVTDANKVSEELKRTYKPQFIRGSSRGRANFGYQNGRGYVNKRLGRRFFPYRRRGNFSRPSLRKEQK